MSQLVADFNSGKLIKGLQEHRKWRFAGQKLFEQAQRKVERRRKERDVWDVVMLNYDVAVKLEADNHKNCVATWGCRRGPSVEKGPKQRRQPSD